MLEELKSKWTDILNIMKADFDIADVSFKTWILPLEVYSYDNDIVTIIVPEKQTGLKIIEKRYTTPLKVTISEVMDHEVDIKFISADDIDNIPKQASAPKPSLNTSVDYQDTGINPKYTFDTFVVGENNNIAHAASLAVSESPGEIYNPLFIYGGAGLGKTHLMHAIANYILEHDKSKKVVYVTSETFTNEIVDAVRDSKNEHSTARQDFRNKYRTVDVLLIDDIQFIEGKEATQLEFFHTFNHLHQQGKQIIISSDKHPSTMTTLEERLRSRFEMGLTVDIKAPTYETRMAILRKKVIEENIAIDDSILDYIASNIVSNIRELQGAINKVISFSNLCGKEVTMELAKEALSDMINPNMKRQITIDYIMETVADHFHITMKDLLSSKRNSNIVYPRHICMYLCRQLTNSTYEEIGSKIGNRHHSTILHGEEIIKKKLDEGDEESIKTIDVLTKKIDPQ